MTTVLSWWISRRARVLTTTSALPGVPHPGDTEPSLRTGMTKPQGGGLLGSNGVPPYRYVVIVEVNDFEQLRLYMAGEEMRGLLSDLHQFAGVVQLMSERFV